MRILGIADGLNSGAALIEDGRIVYAVNEERLIRAKMATGFPRESINRVLKDTHTTPDEIDAVAVAMVNDYFIEKAVAFEGWFLRNQKPFKEAVLSASSHITRAFGFSSLMQRSYYGLKHHIGKTRREALPALLRREWDFHCPVKFIDHHFAHACSAYFTAGLDRATVITMDGAGDNASSHVYHAADGKLRKLCSVDSFNSLGNYYGYITHLCGFRAHRHEGKVTGLAAYGDPIYADILRRFITFEHDRTVNKAGLFYWAAVKGIERALPSSYKIEDLAASMQQVLEDVACAYIGYWTEKSGCGDLALAGGVFANVKLNQRIHKLEGVRSVFIHPAMADEGLAVGAALAVYTSLVRSRESLPVLDHVYLGPGFGDREIENEASRVGIDVERTEAIGWRIAELLARGFVVARFDGRMEYGPRALGNRSILYQATDPTVNDWLNKRLQRTEFMPFAPVTLENAADQCYLHLDGARSAARFMTLTFDCSEWLKKHCPSVVHVDGTARPQIIDPRTNPSYYGILEEYRKLTGLPVLINTSFNMHEEPIVCTPADALRAFLDGHLDYLAMGNYLFRNPRNDVNAKHDDRSNHQTRRRSVG